MGPATARIGADSRSVHTDREIRGVAFSLCGALGVAAFLAWSAGAFALPHFAWSAAFLAAAAFTDLRSRKIPNWLTLGALGLALAASFASSVAVGLEALSGAGVALGLLFLPFAVGAFGAGDVKALMVLGALWGSEVFLPAFLWMLMVGGVFAVCHLAWNGELQHLLLRWWVSLQNSLRERRIAFAPAPAGSASRQGIPFAVCAGVGAAVFQYVRG